MYFGIALCVLCGKFIFISALESSSYVITHSGDISVNSVNIGNVRNVMIDPSGEEYYSIVYCV